MSIRLRLTLLYSGILALTLIAFSVTLYGIVARVTFLNAQNELVDEARRLADPRSPWGGRGREGAPRFASAETFAQRRGPDGSVIERSSNLGDTTLPLSAEGFQAVQGGRAWVESADIGGQTVLVYSQPMPGPGGRGGGILQVARGINTADGPLGALQRFLFGGTALATLLAFGAGWWLAGAALRPINRITQTAQAIGAERDFGRRVAYQGPNDELGRLATTFNSMLEQLQAAYHQTEQSLHAQRRFVADASHELRTPLTTIRGNLGLLQHDPPIAEDDRVAVVSDMVEETERLMRLVQGLLVLARADAGQTVHREPTLVKPVVEEAVRQAQVLATDRALAADPLPDVAVNANRDMLKQTLLILLDNAVQYTPPGGAVTIATTQANGHVSIAVHDTGPGIPPEALPQIFTRFYRGDAARSGNGAGLGLSIAKSLIEAYNGTLTVASQVGQGSTFTITLPAT